MEPTIVALHLSNQSRAPLRAVQQVEALFACGLDGDRHAKPNSRRSVLLMEQEVLDDLGLHPGDVREQVTVRGIELKKLDAGVRLKVGTAVLEVAGACHPCSRMDEIRSGLRTALDGQRGMFVRVVKTGSFGVGDSITVVPTT
jgi:MOSC domain-containing protein YiiM